MPSRTPTRSMVAAAATAAPPPLRAASVTVTVSAAAALRAPSAVLLDGPAPLTDGVAGAAAVTAAAAVGVAAVSVLAPSSASQPARLLGAVSLARCGRGLEAPSHLEHPFQFAIFAVPAPADHDGGGDAPDAEPAPQLASSTVWTLGLLLTLCAPGVFVVAPAAVAGAVGEGAHRSTVDLQPDSSSGEGSLPGKPPSWLKHAGMALAVSTAYFAPAAAASAAALLYRGAFAYVGAAAAVVPALLLALHARLVPLAPQRRRPSTTGGPLAACPPGVAAVVGVAFDGLRAPWDAPTDALVPWHFVAEVAVGVAFGAVTGMQPPATAGLGTCRVLGALGVAVAGLYVVFAGAVRPLASRMETAFSVAVAVGQLGLAVLAALASWGGPAAASSGQFAAWFDVGALTITGLLFAQAAAAAATSLLCRSRQADDMTVAAAAASTAPLLVAPVVASSGGPRAAPLAEATAVHPACGSASGQSAEAVANPLLLPR